ncbi:MAG: hypothetical protein IPO89_10190 [Actinomycetales bacterium]|nr:hypothetical protein [Candidatus Lutibacillus vidarii]
MCDTAVTLTDGGVLFAKNSDRDPNEAQVLQWHPAAVHVPGASVTVTHRAIPQSPSTFATVLSRPWWMWGAEMGANEHGLVIGNEAVFTRKAIGKARRGDEPGLIGMDLLRLALERAATRRDAVQVIVGLLERYGQDGPCSHEKPSFTYDNSFLIADPSGATVLETAGRTYAVEEVAGRGRSISNALTIADFAEAHRDPLRTAVARADTRQAQTAAAARAARTPADLMAMLRSNGGSDPSAGPTWSRVSGAMGAPNMHAGALSPPVRRCPPGSPTCAAAAPCTGSPRPPNRRSRCSSRFVMASRSTSATCRPMSTTPRRCGGVMSGSTGARCGTGRRHTPSLLPSATRWRRGGSPTRRRPRPPSPKPPRSRRAGTRPSSPSWGSGTLARAGCVRPGDGMTTRPGRARGTTAFTHGAPPSLVGRTPT